MDAHITACSVHYTLGSAIVIIVIRNNLDIRYKPRRINKRGLARHFHLGEYIDQYGHVLYLGVEMNLDSPGETRSLGRLRSGFASILIPPMSEDPVRYVSGLLRRV